MEQTNNLQNSNGGYLAVVALLRDHPEWLPVLNATLEEAKAIKGTRFSGAWVLNRAKKHGVHWIPNLRKLVSYGIIFKEGETTRGGRRAYYIMPDMNGVEKALEEFGQSKTESPLYPSHEVTDSGISKKPTVRVPILANLASCGSPNACEEHVEDYAEIDTRIAKPGFKYFFVRADGDSMNMAGINSGDLALVRIQNHADIGQKIVACLEDGVTIKELQQQGEFTVLMPRSSNPDNKPIILTANFEIQGVVIATIPGFK